MKVAIIGAGKVGRTLAEHFFLKEQLAWILDKEIHSISESDLLFGVQYYNSFDEISLIPDIVFISVSDNAIKEVADRLSNRFTNRLQNIIIIHTSGLYPCSLLESCSKYGAIIAKAHPYQSFNKVNIKLLKGIGWGIEVKNSFPIIANIIKQLDGNPIDLNAINNDLRFYHPSAVSSSNFLITPILLGCLLAKKSGLNPEDFIPKIASTSLNNALEFAINNENFPLTGPLARGDIDVLKTHLNSLSSDIPLLRTYSYLALATVELANYYNIISDEEKALLNNFLKVV